MSGGRIFRLTLEKVPTRMVAPIRPATSCLRRSSSSSACATARMLGMNVSPSLVSERDPRLRSSRVTPSSDSSECTVWLTALCVYPSSLAAWVKLPVSTTAQKTW